jgi:hypothetical protein
MKKIIRLTESDLARIVKRVIKENALLTETVPNTAVLAAGGPINGLQARSVCSGADFITEVSIPIKNTGTEAYLIDKPRIVVKTGGVGRISVVDYNVTVNGKPSWSNPDGQNFSMIPKGKTGVLNLIIGTDVRLIESDYQFAIQKANEDFPKNEPKRKAAQDAAIAQRKQNYANFQNATSGVLKITYNGAAPLEIPVNLGPFKIDPKIACDKNVTLPKGFQQ